MAETDDSSDVLGLCFILKKLVLAPDEIEACNLMRMDDASTENTILGGWKNLVIYLWLFMYIMRYVDLWFAWVDINGLQFCNAFIKIYSWFGFPFFLRLFMTSDGNQLLKWWCTFRKSLEKVNVIIDVGSLGRYDAATNLDDLPGNP